VGKESRPTHQGCEDDKVNNYELFIRDCDEHGIPKMDVCDICKKLIPSLRFNLHTKNCKEKKGDKK